MKITILADEFFTIKTWLENEAVMGFEVIQIQSMGESGPNYACFFEKDKHDFEKATKFMSGYIKYDGCASYTFPLQEEAILHACGLRDFKRNYTIMKALYAEAAEYMPDSKDSLLEEKLKHI